MKNSLVTALLLLLAPAAHANIIGNDTQIFNPTTSGLDFVTVQSTETLAPGYVNFGYYLNSAKNVLPSTYDVTGKLVHADDSLLAQDFNLGFGVSRYIDVGLNISNIIKQTTDRTDSGAQFVATGLNEIRTNMKFKLLRRDPIGLAFIPSFNFNQVKNNPFQGNDAGPTFNMELAADKQIGNFLVAANAGYRFRTPGSQIVGSVYPPIHDQAIASLAANYYLPSWSTKFISEVFMSKQMRSSDTIGAESAFASEFLVGANWDATDTLAIRAGATTQINDGLFTPQYRFYVGANWSFLAFNPLNRDGSETVPVAQEQKQQAQPQMNVTNVYNGFQPAEIEAMKKIPFDDLMLKHEFTLRRALDLDKLEAGLSPFEVIRLDGLQFDNKSAELRPESKDLLDRLLRYLKSEPHVLKIRIEGHTDSRGSEKKNQPLSEARADAVLGYLDRNGLPKDIGTEAAGYGATRPIADNSNPQGRQANRRVEVRILRRLKVAPKSR